MRSFVVSLLLLSAMDFTGMPKWCCGADMSACRGLLETPQKVREAWLSFHEADLCQKMDAVFVFNKNGMEVWCRIENEKDYQKLQELFQPLRDSYRIDLYATHPAEDSETVDDWNPPASLWENYELRSYFGDPFARAKERLSLEELNNKDFPPPDDILKLRLFVYAEQILKWNLQMKRYAMDLPALTRLALDPGVASELRLRAGTVSEAHAQKLEKILDRMKKSLNHAFPRYKEKKDSFSQGEKSVNKKKTPVGSAEQIGVMAQNISWRVNRFVYPKQFAIDLDELRQPGLLDTLSLLEGMASDYQKTLAKSVHK
jgi:hypothetical protein